MSDKPTQRCPPDVPIIDNNDLWTSYATRQDLKCNEACFPTNVKGTKLCPIHCVIPLNKVVEAKDNIFSKVDPKYKEDKPPIFIVAYGPTGSGKSNVIGMIHRSGIQDKELINSQKINPQNTVHIDTDKIFQNEEYKKKQNQLDESNPEKTSQNHQRLYSYYRYFADQIADTVLNRVLAERYNSIYETTGFSVDWTIKEMDRIKKIGYHILVVYPWVKIDALLKRIKIRADKTGQTPAPESTVRDLVHRAQQNLLLLASVPGTTVLVVDNNGESNEDKLIFSINNTSCNTNLEVTDATKLEEFIKDADNDTITGFLTGKKSLYQSITDQQPKFYKKIPIIGPLLAKLVDDSFISDLNKDTKDKICSTQTGGNKISNYYYKYQKYKTKYIQLKRLQL